MNSIWNKNISLFIKRFPSLAQSAGITEPSDDIPPHFVSPLEILPSKLKDGNSAQDFYPTAREGGKLLHSMYNPLREADQAVKTLRESTKEPFGMAFFGTGLGYQVLSYSRQFPNDTIILVEYDLRYFFTALANVDWTDFFTAKNIIIALNTGIDSVVSIIEKCGGFSHIPVFQNQVHTIHSSDYFEALNALIERNKRKAQINTNTLEKFSGLWLKNSCRNLNYLAELDGVDIYREKLNPEIPVLILAAGPTLENVLPHLKELKKRTVIIAVDTALRACLRENVEPDFIILADPQYYAYRHIAGLSSPSSVLITESAAYPSVLRFNCRKKVMCSSMFPLGQFVEAKIGQKGQLAAGGSVSTTAWDFARFIGAKLILCAGLDLGYPSLQTHIRGSTFEEKIHTVSTRFSTAEKSGISALFGAGMETDSDYEGRSILTDNRMKMFAWWFESKQEEYSSAGIRSFSLSSQSLKIPGFKITSLQEALLMPEICAARENFFSQSEDSNELEQERQIRVKLYEEAINQIKTGLEELYLTARKGLSIVEKAAAAPKPSQPQFIKDLEIIDSKILRSNFKDIAALVFPTENQLNEIFSKFTFSSDPLSKTFQHSKIIYKELMQSIREYQKKLFEQS